MVKIELTTEELQLLWALCMAELSEDFKPLARKLTYAIKEKSNG